MEGPRYFCEPEEDRPFRMSLSVRRSPDAFAGALSSLDALPLPMSDALPLRLPVSAAAPLTELAAPLAVAAACDAAE